MKKCSRCCVVKIFSEFRRAKGYRDGLHCWCKACWKLYLAEYKEKTRETHKKRRYAASRKWDSANREARKRISNRARIKKEYGISLEEYERLLILQDGKCKICRRSKDDGIILVLDHCHVSGRIRGFLCSPCNSALGFF